MRLYLVELIDVCWLYWRTLLAVIRFCVWYRPWRLRICSKILFMYLLIISTVNQRPGIFFIKMLFFLHRVNRRLLNLRWTELVWHHCTWVFFHTSRYHHFLILIAKWMSNRRCSCKVLRCHYLLGISLLYTPRIRSSVIVRNSLVDCVWSYVLLLSLENLAILWSVDKVGHITVPSDRSAS